MPHQPVQRLSRKHKLVQYRRTVEHASEVVVTILWIHLWDRIKAMSLTCLSSTPPRHEAAPPHYAHPSTRVRHQDPAMSRCRHSLSLTRKKTCCSISEPLQLAPAKKICPWKELISFDRYIMETSTGPGESCAFVSNICHFSIAMSIAA
jgi:hypothetical protein